MKMAKKIAILSLPLLLLMGCQKSSQGGEQQQSTAEEIAQEPEIVVENVEPDVMLDAKESEDFSDDTVVDSYLTGEKVPASIGRKRPIAIMLNNIKAAVPQAGIANAAVVYEVPVEGGITRLMGIFEDYKNLERIGSVRSCRDYFIFYAMGFDAIYAHYGQAIYAVPYLALDNVDNLSGLDAYGDDIYYRSSDRVSPHNVYTNYERLQEGISLLGYDTRYDKDYKGYYHFAEKGSSVKLSDAVSAKKVETGYEVNEGWFSYDEKEKLYKRYQYDDEQIDELTDEQLTYKNIILQYSQWKNYDKNGYLNIDTDTPGAGKYITEGKAIDISWHKDDPWGPTKYFDKSGKEITLNTGKTWVCIILDTQSKKVKIS